MSIKIPTVKHTGKYKKFEGDAWFNMVAMHYLTTKFKNQCVVIPFKTMPDEHTDVSIRWIQLGNSSKGKLHIPKNFWSELNRHLEHNNRFIAFPFGFTCEDQGGHANYLVYDTDNGTLSRFDGVGGDSDGYCVNTTDADKALKRIFNQKMGAGFVTKLIKPYQKLMIFQTLQEAEKIKKLSSDPVNGFCSAWACWWVEYRMSNPDVSRKRLAMHFIKHMTDTGSSYTKFIRDYSQAIVANEGILKQCIRERSRRK